jgi:predicted transcriptional regulator YheO
VKNDRLPAWLEPYAPLCEAVAALFHPLVEITVEDLRRDRVVAAWNSDGLRRPGARVSALAAAGAADGVVGPVATVLPDGRAVTTVSVVLANAKGAPRGLLSITFDRSPLDEVVALLGRFATPAQAPQVAPEEGEWRERIARVVDEECRERGLRRDRLSRGQRLALVSALDGRGLFATRHAAVHVAQALGVSRTTVYDLLKEARS